MQIMSVEPTGIWGFKVTALVLAFYFLVLLPSGRILLRGSPWLFANADTVFFASVILILFATRKTDLAGLGFSTKYLKQHLILGAVIGVPLVLALPLLNTGLELLGGVPLLGGGPESKVFFSGPPPRSSFSLGSIPGQLMAVLLVPLIEQMFFTGFVVQSLLRKYNSVLVIYGAGLIYTLAGFQLTLASFALGLIAGGLFKLTGTLYASILFHMSCVLAGILLVEVYPRLITLLGFLL